MGAQSEQLLELLVVLVQSFLVELCNSGEISFLIAFVLEGGKLTNQKLHQQAAYGAVPVFRPIVQRERQSEGFHCIVITTGPSSGGIDNLKVLDVLDGVFTRSATEFRQKVYQSGLEFKVGIKFRKSVGLVVESCARTTQLFES
ncbi:hypothetical protein PIB30_024237 [Stylosanthes scabra]|uniref:Uncharacterized protein n=1 Tax=Stylosanthes scabra TaxID=79078 RepID=A0ABU6T9J8_9FABA|nr:hypothetical protein [Stylosanthes scabra]